MNSKGASVSEIKERLIVVFAKGLGVEESLINTELEYESIPDWDSIGHLSLIAAIEEAFEVSFSTEEVIEMSTFEKAYQLVLSKKS